MLWIIDIKCNLKILTYYAWLMFSLSFISCAYFFIGWILQQLIFFFPVTHNSIFTVTQSDSLTKYIWNSFMNYI